MNHGFSIIDGCILGNNEQACDYTSLGYNSALFCDVISVKGKGSLSCQFQYVWRKNNQWSLWARFIIAVKDIYYNSLELLDDEI